MGAEFRFYKQKVDFLEKESEMQMQRLKTQGPMMMDDEPTDIDFDIDSLDMSEAARQKMMQLAKAVQRKDARIEKLRNEGSLNTDELIDALQGSGTQAEALKKILNANKAAQIKVHEAEAVAEKAQRSAAMLSKRDSFNQNLQANWKNQLKQMEKAVLMCSEIHKRDRKKYTGEIAQKDEQIAKLKIYIEKANALAPAPSRASSDPERTESRTPSTDPRTCSGRNAAPPERRRRWRRLPWPRTKRPGLGCVYIFGILQAQAPNA